MSLTYNSSECRHCNGSGKRAVVVSADRVSTMRCEHCGGSGEASKVEKASRIRRWWGKNRDAVIPMLIMPTALILMASLFYTLGYRTALREKTEAIIFDGKITCFKWDGGEPACTLQERSPK